MIQQSLQNALKQKHIDREVVTLITQTIVDPHDPSIKKPSKFIGRCYTKEDGKQMTKKWQILALFKVFACIDSNII